MNIGETEFQDYLGKHIKEINTINKGKLKHNTDLKRYSLFSEVGLEFYNKKYHNLTISTNGQDTIKEITLFINGIIDNTFYDNFNGSYGLPNSILVIDLEKDIKKSEVRFNNGLSSTVKKQTISLKEGIFEEKPQTLTWNKNDYQIRFFFRYDIKMTIISFRSQ